MGQLGTSLSAISFKYMSETYDEIEKIEKNENDSYYKEIIDKLYTFFMSDNFIFSCLYPELYESIFNIVSSCDSKEKYLFLKILFPLFEQLKQNNFEKQLEKISNFNEKDLLYEEKGYEEMIYKLDELYIISFIFIFKCYDIDSKDKFNNSENYKNKILECIYEISEIDKDKDDNKVFVKEILDILNKINSDSLIYTKELYQLFIFGFNLINSKEIKKEHTKF